jgi:CheY-like chemotaxis protein
VTTTSKSPLRGKILVLEEEPGTRGLMARALEKAGADVRQTSSWGEAEVALAESPPDIMILALRLTGGDGAAICRSLKANVRTRGLPILMLAPKSAPEDVMACLDAGCDDILAKPFFAPEVVARVRAHLRARRLFEALTKERKEVETLLRIHRSLNSKTSPEAVLESLVKILHDVVGVRRASVILASNDPRYGYAMASSDSPVKNLEIDLRRYPEIARVMNTRKPLVVEEALTSALFAPFVTQLTAAKIRSILAIPIEIDDAAVATLLLHTRGEKKRFSQREIRLCSVAAQAAGMALKSSHFYQVSRGRRSR